MTFFDGLVAAAFMGAGFSLALGFLLYSQSAGSERVKESLLDRLAGAESALIALAGKTGLFRRRKRYMTQDEWYFFDVLEQATKGQYYVFPRVSLSHLVAMTDGIDTDTLTGAVMRQEVDYVLFDTHSEEPVLAVELHGPTHSRDDKQAHDRMLKSVLNDAAIPLMIVVKRGSYDPDDIHQLSERIEMALSA